MWRFGLRQALRLLLDFAGAFLLAAAIAALSVATARNGTGAFLAAWLSELGSFLRLDFGMSMISGARAVHDVGQSLPVTLELVGLGAIVALIVGAPLGILLGAERPLRAAAPLIQIVAAMPVFCASLALLWFAANVFHWPDMNDIAKPMFSALIEPDGTSALRALSLPVLTVGAAGAAIVQLALRRAAAEAMDEPYRRGLRLMGLTAFEINIAYLAPQVLASLLRSLGEIVLALFAAAAVAEWVFGWPGAAVLFLRSVALQDWTVAALILLVFAFIKIFADALGEIGAYALTVEGGPA